MKAMRKPAKKTRSYWIVNKWDWIFIGLVAVFSLIIEYLGGIGPIPTWEQLYRSVGIYNGCPAEDPAGDRARIHFIDVGQGDAVLVEQDGLFALIDAGGEQSEVYLLPYLKSCGVEKLDLVVMTHPHEDHIGGMNAVLRQITVEELWVPDFTKSKEPKTLAYTQVMDAARAGNTRIRSPREGSQFSLGSGNITLISNGIPSYALPSKSGDGYNDLSLCVRFDSGSFSFLDTGDGEEPAEEKLLKYGQPLQATLFKAGHHGSYTSNTEAFLQAVRPKIVVVSCGKDNPHGHPDQNVLENFDQVGATVYRTDLQGHIVVTADSSGRCQIDTQKKLPKS